MTAGREYHGRSMSVDPVHTPDIGATQRLMMPPTRPSTTGADELSQTERACCCAAIAAVRVRMPPTATRRHSTDLLLCAHHYRQSEDKLLAAGAIAFDRQGRSLRHFGPYFLPPA